MRYLDKSFYPNCIFCQDNFIQVRFLNIYYAKCSCGKSFLLYPLSNRISRIQIVLDETISYYFQSKPKSIHLYSTNGLNKRFIKQENLEKYKDNLFKKLIKLNLLV